MIDDDFHNVDGMAHCEGVPLAEIAAQVGTPTYVYSTSAMTRRARALQEAVGPAGDVLVAYAVKANPAAAVLATFARQGLGADVVSGGEYLRAFAAGVDPHAIVFSGVGKTAEEMATALRGGIRQFNLESLEEAEMLAGIAQTMGKRAPVAIRVNPDVEAGSHPKISTGAACNKFGIALADVPAIYARLAKWPGLDLRGLAVHIGSQLTRLDGLEAAFRKIGDLVTDLRRRGLTLSTVDLGGGLGIHYNPADHAPPTIAEYGAMIARVTNGWNVRLIVEPGRWLVGDAGVLLSRVIRVKRGTTRPFVILDAGMNDLMRPALYDAWHKIEAVDPTGERMIADVVGPVCETGDTFALARDLDLIEAGSLVMIRQAGAYAATMASTYNSRPLPAEVLVSDGSWATVRERDDPQAFLQRERIPIWLHGDGHPERQSLSRSGFAAGSFDS